MSSIKEHLKPFDEEKGEAPSGHAPLPVVTNADPAMEAVTNTSDPAMEAVTITSDPAMEAVTKTSDPAMEADTISLDPEMEADILRSDPEMEAEPSNAEISVTSRSSAQRDLDLAQAAQNLKIVHPKEPRRASYYKDRRQARREAKIADGTWTFIPPKRKTEQRSPDQAQRRDFPGRGATETPKRQRSENSTPSSSASKYQPKRQQPRHGQSYPERSRSLGRAGRSPPHDRQRQASMQSPRHVDSRSRPSSSGSGAPSSRGERQAESQSQRHSDRSRPSTSAGRPSTSTGRPSTSAGRPSSSASRPRHGDRRQATTQSHLTYADFLSGMKLGIAPSEYPDRKFEGDEFEIVQSLIYSRAVPLASGVLPQFLDCKQDGGALVLHCANQETKDWLVETVAKVGNMEKFKLLVADARKLLNQRKAIVTIPALLNAVKVDNVISLFQDSNKGIKTTDWRVVNCSAEAGQGRTLVLYLNETDCNELKKRDLKLFLGLGQVKFRIIEKTQPSRKDGPEDNSSQHSA